MQKHAENRKSGSTRQFSIIPRDATTNRERKIAQKNPRRSSDPIFSAPLNRRFEDGSLIGGYGLSTAPLYSWMPRPIPSQVRNSPAIRYSPLPPSPIAHGLRPARGRQCGLWHVRER